MTTLDESIKQRRKDEQKGLKLLQQYVSEYNIVKYPNVDNDLIDKLMRGLKLLGIRYVVNVGDEEFCPQCKHPTGNIEKELLSLYSLTGSNTLCVYCSIESEYKLIMKHNFGDCDHPLADKKDGKRCWSRKDCLAMYRGFEEMYNEILDELKDDDYTVMVPGFTTE